MTRPLHHQVKDLMDALDTMIKLADWYHDQFLVSNDADGQEELNTKTWSKDTKKVRKQIAEAQRLLREMQGD